MSNDLLLLDNQDFVSSIEKLFKDQIKFGIFNKGLTVTWIPDLQNYLRSLWKWEEISKAEFDQMKLKNVKPTRAHGLPKIHKILNNTPKFDQS